MSVNGLEITDVIIFPVKSRDGDGQNLKAFAKIVVNDQLILNGFRVFSGKNGLFVSPPKEYDKARDKSFDICFPITAELRSYITDQVLSQYSISVSCESEVP